jgi:hypothetical protein
MPPAGPSSGYAKARLTRRRANDILRATGLTAASLDDPGVMKDLIKVLEGQRLSSGRRHRR